MRTVVALSGGVDSALAAARLKASGADLLAVHLRTGVEAEGQAAGGARSCCGLDDARDARAVAHALEIPFYVVDVADAFRMVLDDFQQSYASGRTPNPCILCNRYVKFGRLLEIARGLGAQRVATGHYAQVQRNDRGRYELRKGADASKDQSYVLCTLTQEQLAAAVFPLGADLKSDVRAEAAQRGLDVAAKPDSQELCFVPAQGGHRAWLREQTPESFRAGAFVDAGGVVVGQHDGAVGFTTGQRRGLPALGTPHYVSGVDVPAGTVRIEPRAALLHRTVDASQAHWISEAPLPAGTRRRVQVRIRHAGPATDAELQVLAEDRVRFVFDEPVFAAARGQAAVAYEDARVLLGATIEEALA